MNDPIAGALWACVIFFALVFLVFGCMGIDPGGVP